jgi:hypothetical protein
MTQPTLEILLDMVAVEQVLNQEVLEVTVGLELFTY